MKLNLISEKFSTLQQRDYLFLKELPDDALSSDGSMTTANSNYRVSPKMTDEF